VSVAAAQRQGQAANARIDSISIVAADDRGLDGGGKEIAVLTDGELAATH
jgi:hypothetical protein